MQEGEPLNDDESRWHASYPKHSDFAATRRVLDYAQQRQA